MADDPFTVLTIMNNCRPIFPRNIFFQFPQKLITALGNCHTCECHWAADWCRKKKKKGSYGIYIPQLTMLDAASVPFNLKYFLTSINSLLSRASNLSWFERKSCYNGTSLGIGIRKSVFDSGFWLLSVCHRASYLTSLFLRSLLWKR